MCADPGDTCAPVVHIAAAFRRDRNEERPSDAVSQGRLPEILLLKVSASCQARRGGSTRAMVRGFNVTAKSAPVARRPTRGRGWATRHGDMGAQSRIREEPARGGHVQPTEPTKSIHADHRPGNPPLSAAERPPHRRGRAGEDDRGREPEKARRSCGHPRPHRPAAPTEGANEVGAREDGRSGQQNQYGTGTTPSPASPGVRRRLILVPRDVSGSGTMPALYIGNRSIVNQTSCEGLDRTAHPTPSHPLRLNALSGSVSGISCQPSRPSEREEC